MFNSFGVGEILIFVFNVIILCIPLILVWILVKSLRKISDHSEQNELEMKALREEIHSLRENQPASPQK